MASDRVPTDFGRDLDATHFDPIYYFAISHGVPHNYANQLSDALCSELALRTPREVHTYFQYMSPSVWYDAHRAHPGWAPCNGLNIAWRMLLHHLKECIEDEERRQQQAEILGNESLSRSPLAGLLGYPPRAKSPGITTQPICPSTPPREPTDAPPVYPETPPREAAEGAEQGAEAGASPERARPPAGEHSTQSAAASSSSTRAAVNSSRARTRTVVCRHYNEVQRQRRMLTRAIFLRDRTRSPAPGQVVDDPNDDVPQSVLDALDDNRDWAD